MNVRSVSFETWLINHSDDHAAKWCRELYPWEIFAAIDYSSAAINHPQELESASGQFLATVQKAFVGDNGRPNFLVHLKSLAVSKTQQWRNRDWDDIFQLVCAPDGHFITLYTKRQDPSKELLRRFMAGGLPQIELERSLPISGMLFRSLISYAARDIFGPLRLNPTMGRRRATAQSGGPNSKQSGYLPFMNSGRDLWLMYAFTEEKAHRIALANSGNCQSLIVVYCHPTFSQHHRCNAKNTRVLSLSEFLGMGSGELRVRYMSQMRLLINHLHADDTVPPATEEALRLQILNGKGGQKEITTSELREAKVGLGRVISSKGDAAYVLACANLLNAAMNKKLGLYKGTQTLAKEVYSFKAHLAKSLEELVQNCPMGTEVDVSQDDLILVRIDTVQFSFHAISRTPLLREYAASRLNVRQEWSRIRLQPIAPVVLAWARALLRAEGAIRT